MELRSRYGYQNIMFLAAGQIIPSVTGKTWDDFIRERIFTPLGMKSSTTSIKAFAAPANVATPHSKINDKLQAVSWRNIDNIAPAGSINSNVQTWPSGCDYTWAAALSKPTLLSAAQSRRCKHRRRSFVSKGCKRVSIPKRTF